MYYLLDDLPDNHTLEFIPAQLWLILTLEVTVQDDFGTYILLTYPSYGFNPVAVKEVVECYWTPPFVAYPVISNMTFSLPETVGAIRRQFRHFEKKIDAQTVMEQLAYHLGFSSPEIRLGFSFTELQRSQRTPELVKCYKIVRCSLESTGRMSHLNLADPECKKGHVFLPLDDLSDVIIKRWSPSHEREEWTYLSKPIISNVQVLIENPDVVTQLKSRAISLKASDFYREEEGIVLNVDLAGYGTACKYASERMHSFDRRGNEIATQFRHSIALIFYQFFARTGIFQIHMAGDGFICTLPKRAFPDGGIIPALQKIEESYREILKRVEQFNSYIVDESARIGSRIALHYGPYKYGRIAQARSVGADFDGAVIIEVARLEGALSAFTKSPTVVREAVSAKAKTTRSKASTSEKGNANSEKSDVRSRRIQHAAICSTSIMNEASDFFLQNENMSYVIDLDVGVKEFEAKATILELLDL